MHKWFLIIGALIIVVIIGFYVRSKGPTATPPTKNIITNFEECEAAGYPIGRSYPPVCTTPDGQTFSPDIGNELEYSDLIQVTSPRPNQAITSPIEITGQARGGWYFEANFPIEFQDANGIVIGTSFGTAAGEWMTEKFVPFTAEIIFTQPTTETGNLIIKNANPSGLPENEKTLTIPVKFQE